MFGLCKYKDIFGAAGDNSYTRFLGVRLQDVVFLFVGVFVFCYFTKNSFWKTLAFTLILMVIFHHLFCVRSATDKLLFPQKNDGLRLAIYTFIGIYLIYYFRLTPTIKMKK